MAKMYGPEEKAKLERIISEGIQILDEIDSALDLSHT